MRELDQARGVPVIDVTAAWKTAIAAGASLESLLSQSNHPNARGHALAAAAINDFLLRECQHASVPAE